jgi:hypothetical protein
MTAPATPAPRYKSNKILSATENSKNQKAVYDIRYTHQQQDIPTQTVEGWESYSIPPSSIHFLIIAISAMLSAY